MQKRIMCLKGYKCQLKLVGSYNYIAEIKKAKRFLGIKYWSVVYKTGTHYRKCQISPEFAPYFMKELYQSAITQYEETKKIWADEYGNNTQKSWFIKNYRYVLALLAAVIMIYWTWYVFIYFPQSTVLQFNYYEHTKPTTP